MNATEINPQVEQAFDDFDKANDLQSGTTLNVVLNRPEMVEKMKDFLTRNGIVCQRTLSPEQLSGMVYTQYRKWAKDYEKKERSSFLGNEDAFDSYKNSDIYSFGESAYIQEREKESGFEGFDNFAVGAALKAGRAIVKKVSQKVKEAKARKKAKEIGEQAEKTATSAGIAVPTTAQALTGKEVINDIKFELAKVAEQYKESEKNKYIKEKTPMIILIVGLLVVIGFFIGKSAK